MVMASLVYKRVFKVLVGQRIAYLCLASATIMVEQGSRLDDDGSAMDENTMEAAQLNSTVRHWLSAVRISDDARLPAERELAKKFRVSRAELRKVLAVLEAEGQIQRHVGKGTFVVHPPADSRPNGQDIAERTSPLAAMQARRVVEPELARLAALNATSAQFVEMRKLCSEMRRAPTWDAYAELDWRFHNLIAEATGNVLLVEIQRLLNGVRRFVVWGNLVKRAEGPPSDYHSFGEHEEILDAIQAREGDRAMQAMLSHLGGTQSQLINYPSIQEHEAV
jgi:DNA-binding FadR family transcriptional regulator